jgi:hypothetical protein
MAGALAHSTGTDLVTHRGDSPTSEHVADAAIGRKSHDRQVEINTSEAPAVMTGTSPNHAQKKRP